MLEYPCTLCYRNVGEALSLCRREGEDHLEIDWIPELFCTYEYYVSTNCSINV